MTLSIPKPKFDIIYSKSANNFFAVPIKPLSTIDNLEQPLAFLHTFLYAFRNNIQGLDSLDRDHWNNLQNYQESIFVYENCSEPTDYITLAKTFNDLVSTHKISPNQIYIIVADEIQASMLKIELTKYKLDDIHIDYLAKCLLATKIPAFSNQIPSVKFSLMSRRYVEDRLLLLCELVKNNLIDDFAYSFHNTNPYFKQVTNIDVLNLPLHYQTDEIDKWVKGIPYYVNNEYDNYMEQFSNKMYNAILQSNIHLVVETMYHETIYGYNRENIVPWITEKTYKAIACKKIFLCYSMTGTLATLKKMGFKTFDHILDESYDLIVDPIERRTALVKEIKRIAGLDLNNLAELSKDVVEHNFNLLIEKKNKQWHQEFSKIGIFK
jgi:hypothetical protein